MLLIAGYSGNPICLLPINHTTQTRLLIYPLNSIKRVLEGKHFYFVGVLL